MYRVAEIVAPPIELPVFSDAWKARCRTCRHLDLVVQSPGNEVMRCSRYRRGIGWGGRVTIAGYCIDARDDGPCGPDAALWEAR